MSSSVVTDTNEIAAFQAAVRTQMVNGCAVAEKSVSPPPYLSVSKEERTQLKELVFSDTEVLIASKSCTACHCYAFSDEEAEPPPSVLSIPAPVRSQEIRLLRQFALSCESTKVYVMNNMVADITLGYDGMFTLHRPSQQLIANLHSLELLYLVSPQTTADRDLFETRGHSDPTYALDQLTFASNPWKSLAVLVAEKEDQMAVATSTSTSASTSTSTSTSATVSPQALLQKAKAKEAELRAEIELWRAVRAQQQINKDLEKQLAALKELV